MPHQQIDNILKLKLRKKKSLEQYIKKLQLNLTQENEKLHNLTHYCNMYTAETEGRPAKHIGIHLYYNNYSFINRLNEVIVHQQNQIKQQQSHLNKLNQDWLKISEQVKHISHIQSQRKILAQHKQDKYAQEICETYTNNQRHSKGESL